MSITNRIFENVENLCAWVSMLLKQSPDSYCDLETADSESTLITKDASLISVIHLRGIKMLVGPSEFDDLCESISSALTSLLSSDGHIVQFFYNFDPDAAEESIKEILKPSVDTANKINLEIDDIFNSRCETLKEICAEESCYIAITTQPKAIPSNRVIKRIKENASKLKSQNVPLLKSGANLFLGVDELRNLHRSIISTLIEDLRSSGLYIELLNIKEAARAARMSIDKNFTSKDWLASFPGDPIPIKLDSLEYESEIKKRQHDLSDMMWPSLSSQIIPREGENISIKFARIGDLIYAPLYIELFPKDVKNFYDFFRKGSVSNFPWRASFFISPKGIDVTKSKHRIAQFLAFSSIQNKLIVETHRYLKNLDERGDDPVIKLKVIFLTWASNHQTELLEQRISKLSQLVQSWGGCEVKEFYGDPYGEVISSSLGVRNKTSATASAAPLSSVTSMLPITRPASPWKKGAVLFRTPDGKLWPYQPGSNHQISWVDIIYARSGSGKSVLLNSLNLGLCLSPGLSQLPRVSIIDIGPSSKGLISLLKEGLEKKDQKKALYCRLKLENGYAINPFDTQLGARVPTKLHRSFLINFLSLLFLENPEDKSPKGLSGMLSLLVDTVYKEFEDLENPKKYIAGFDTYIDQFIDKWQLKIPKNATWWEITDQFFKLKQYPLAERAQRYAMPTLSDTISIAHQQGIKDIFCKVYLPESKENYVDAYCRNMSVMIRNYPTLSMPTQLSLENARVIALDLEDVARSGSNSANKQTAMVYMLARHVVAQNFFLRTDDIKLFPILYRPFHKLRIQEMMEEPKRIVYDEFHRTAYSSHVREQVVQDMREGRKWKVQISLASQSLHDFDHLMVEFATGVFILDSGSTQSIEETSRIFGLNETQKIALKTCVHGPKPYGTNFIAQFVTKQGINTQLLTSTVSPLELWAFNTSAEDVYIRDRLYQLLGAKEARLRLSSYYPSGSAIKEIESIVNEGATIKDVCNKIIQKILNHN